MSLSKAIFQIYVRMTRPTPRDDKCVLGAPSKLKNGEKRDIVQKGGRGLDQNPSFKLSRKNDMSNRREGGYDVLSSF